MTVGHLTISMMTNFDCRHPSRVPEINRSQWLISRDIVSSKSNQLTSKSMSPGSILPSSATAPLEKQQVDHSRLLMA